MEGRELEEGKPAEGLGSLTPGEEEKPEAINLGLR